MIDKQNEEILKIQNIMYEAEANIDIMKRSDLGEMAHVHTENPTTASRVTALITSSEDITIIDDRISKYLKLQDEIKKVISAGEKDRDALIEDVVNAFFKLRGSLTVFDIGLGVATVGIIPLQNHLKRKKLKKVIDNILGKIFDVTLGWYAMDYDDVKETCDFYGGKDSFTSSDHRYIYTAVIQKLKAGPIRDKCIRLKIVVFVNEKLIDIRNNLMEFKKNNL